MRSFFITLHQRNKLLYYTGWLFFIGGLISIIIGFFDHTRVLGINAWIKPTKFFLSIGILNWTMAWLLHELEKPRAIKSYSIMLVLVMVFEQAVIVWQAANGRLSHFNISKPLYLWLYNAMGVAIVTATIWTVYITVLFFTKKDFKAPMTYIWGIRLGLVMYIIFSFEGGIMAAQLRHTVGAMDGGDGIPFVNWSGAYGDLRVAHFFGIHALQILPLSAYYIARKKWQIFLVAALYFAWVSIMFLQAMNGIPLYKQ